MISHWEKSQIPYFVVLQDTSSLQAQPHKCSQEDTHRSNDDESNDKRLPMIAPPTCTYPDIEYVFFDDPDYDTLETEINRRNEQDNTEEEQAIIIELDASGEKVLNYSSLSPELQVLELVIKDRNNTKTIEVDVTRCVVDGVDTLGIVPEVDYVRQLGELWSLRNAQLKKIMDE